MNGIEKNTCSIRAIFAQSGESTTLRPGERVATSKVQNFVVLPHEMVYVTLQENVLIDTIAFFWTPQAMAEVGLSIISLIPDKTGAVKLALKNHSQNRIQLYPGDRILEYSELHDYDDGDDDDSEGDEVVQAYELLKAYLMRGGDE
jgi:hypothetical protein